MKSKRIISTFIAIVFSTQTVLANQALVSSARPVYSQGVLDLVQFEKIVENVESELNLDILDVETEPDQSRAERRAHKIINRRLNRNFRALEKASNRLIKLSEDLDRGMPNGREYQTSEEYLRGTLTKQFINTGAVLDSVNAEQQIDLIVAQNGSAKNALLSLSSDTFKQTIREKVNAEIKAKGSAVNYLKSLKVQTKKILCIARNVGISAAIVAGFGLGAVSLGIGMVLGLAGGALGSLFWPAMITWAATFWGGGFTIMSGVSFLQRAEGSCNMSKRKPKQ